MLGKNMLEMHNALNAPRASITDDKWVRPAAWIDLSDCPEGSIYMMAAIMNEGETELNFTVGAKVGYGTQFIVDWGDGTIEDINSGFPARHIYQTSAGEWIGEYYSGVLVKITPKTETIGNQITSFSLIDKEYSSNKYSANIVSIYFNCPELTTLNNAFGKNSTVGYTARLLEEVIIMKAQKLINLDNAFINCTNLKKVYIEESVNLQTCVWTFYGCTNLFDINLFDTSKCTNFSGMFKSCSSLRKILPFDLSSANSIVSMFEFCTLITEIPEGFNTSHIFYFDNCFNGCIALRDISNLDISNLKSGAYLFSNTAIKEIDMILPYATNVNYMFNLCKNLKYVNKFEAPLATAGTRLFYNCTSLISVTSLKIPLVASVLGIFEGCISLSEIYEIDMSGATDASNAFKDCSSLLYIPEITLPKITNLSSTFLNCHNIKNISLVILNPTLTTLNWAFNKCYSLETISNMNTTKVTNFQQCFYECRSLTLIPQYSYALVSNGGLLDIVKGCSNLGGVLNFSSCTVSYTSSMLDISYTKITGLISPIQFKHNINVSNTLMDATALNALFTGLPTAGTTNKTITITGTPGAATCDRSIATNKGWVISG